MINVGETLSINHNWINMQNLEYVLDYLESVFVEIQGLIQEHSDMDDFQEHCQKILKANCGMNIHGFLEMIDHSMEIRIKRYTQNYSMNDRESLIGFWQVLNRCISSQIAGESFPKIQLMRNRILTFIQDMGIIPLNICLDH